MEEGAEKLFDESYHIDQRQMEEEDEELEEKYPTDQKER